MKYCKYLLLLPLAFMATGCSDENKEIVEEETQASSSNQLKSIYLDRNAMSDFLWNVGETIPFCFENGNETDQKLVRNCMCEWMQYANIRFEEFEPEDRELTYVRIKFDYSGTSSGGWSTKGSSYPGKFYNCQVPINQPTMIIYSNRMKSNNEKRATILHELGHVLGLLDEHYNRNSGLTWNAAKIKQDIGNAQYDSLFGAQPQAIYNAISVSGQFDPSSIMMYPIPASWNNQGRSFSQNYTLSAKDIATIKSLYPYPANVVPIFSGSYSGTASVLAKFNQFTNKSDVRWLAGYGYTSQKNYTAPLYRYRHKQTGKILCSYERVNYADPYGNSLVNATDFVRIDNSPIAYVYVTMHSDRYAIVNYYTRYSPRGYNVYNMQTYYGCTAQPDNYINPEHNLIVPGYWGALSAIAQ
ncbi:MAG: hypothetical protein K6G31_08230 [Paludibacteraceae bacterium]|nr:hypothetical protein [Paludibacteraceae bacterium]